MSATLGFPRDPVGCVLRPRYLWAIAWPRLLLLRALGRGNWIPDLSRDRQGFFSFKEPSIAGRCTSGRRFRNHRRGWISTSVQGNLRRANHAVHGAERWAPSSSTAHGRSLWIDYARSIAIGFAPHRYGARSEHSPAFAGSGAKKAAGTAAATFLPSSATCSARQLLDRRRRIADRWGWGGVFRPMVAGACLLTIASAALPTSATRPRAGRFAAGSASVR